MKVFTFDHVAKGKTVIDDNGCLFRAKVNRFGVFSLTMPIQKEVTYTKGPVIRYIKHTVVGIGYARIEPQFCGIAFFDLHIRVPIVLLILMGVAYASGTFISGVFWAGLFYLLISFLYASDDESLMHRIKTFFNRTSEMQC